LQDGAQINYSKLARDFGLHHKTSGNEPRNGGQIIKAMLTDQNIDTSNLSTLPNSGTRFRRRKRK